MRTESSGGHCLATLPIETIYTIVGAFRSGGTVVLEQDVIDDIDDAVRIDPLPPAKVCDDIIDTFETGVTVCLHGIATSPAETGDATTGAHEDWIGRVAKGPDVFGKADVRLVLPRRSVREDGQA